ncbi:hypothetical protein [uncultured Duncaniella sp.]|uniref:hypothetical protein n=1 Tax=uncultured Duncaniella sp. TaxID=2768039 RepID=UPI00272CDB3F|nr:hypothetical protein [uncultured Duncaniella sp.]
MQQYPFLGDIRCLDENIRQLISARYNPVPMRGVEMSQNPQGIDADSAVSG